MLDAGADPKGPAQRGAGAQQELGAGGGGLALLGGSLELLSASGLCSLAGCPVQLRSSALSSRITLLTKYFALT